MELEGVRWLFFDLGYTLINEDAAMMGRLRQGSDALRQRGIEASPEALRAALDEAATRFEPEPILQSDSRIHPRQGHHRVRALVR